MHYYKLGDIPHKRHIQFRKKDGSLYHEELFSTAGFSDVYSTLYHTNPPTAIKQIGDPINVGVEMIKDNQLKPRLLKGANVPAQDDYLKSRVTVLANNDCQIIIARPRHSMTDYFFKNADSDEVIFIHKGTGKLKTMYGVLGFEYGDYLVVPRGTAYQLEFDQEDNKLLITTSSSPVTTPRRYRNEVGQLLEHSPFCERDIRKPEILETHDEEGSFLVYVKKEDMLYPYSYQFHPFGVVGWDGFLYPYAFSIHNFEPITGRVHQPPPVHQTFATAGFVICSFVPRLYDYHPQSIPAPYYHSNVDSDEVLYYVDGDFMSRNNVEQAMLTIHPAGIVHGPHPGSIERSIGETKTEELAVMIDTFKPLYITKAALELEDPDYYKVWLIK